MVGQAVNARVRGQGPTGHFFPISRNRACIRLPSRFSLDLNRDSTPPPPVQFIGAV